MELPAGEVAKLQGPATIEGDALTVSLFNGTDWHVSEVSVALTVVKKRGPRDGSVSDGTDLDSMTADGTLPYNASAFFAGVAGNPADISQVRPEKKPDLTLIYRMRAAAPPFSPAVFSAPLNLDLAPNQEWHWAIVQAKGYPPQSYAGNTPQTTAQSKVAPSVQPAGLIEPQDPATVAPTQNPH